jgi:hypothetical protein
MYLNEGKEQIITTINSAKNRITLIDNSVWEVDDINSYKLALWLIMNKAIIKKSFINFEITNTNKNETLKVKQIL